MAKFAKGQSGNPGGRPKTEIAVRDLAREQTEAAIAALVNALSATNEGVRVSAAQALLDRGWGKPVATVEAGPTLAKMLFAWAE
jgi:HEAT repeat protein